MWEWSSYTISPVLMRARHLGKEVGVGYIYILLNIHEQIIL